jgi:hypothetical protein
VSWFPFVALWPMMSVCSYECVSEKLYIASFWLSYLNSLFTPLVLLYNNAKYRKPMYVLKARLSCCSSSFTGSWSIRSWCVRLNRHLCCIAQKTTTNAKNTRIKTGGDGGDSKKLNGYHGKNDNVVTVKPNHTTVDMADGSKSKQGTLFRFSLNNSSSMTNATNRTNRTNESYSSNAYSNPK